MNDELLLKRIEALLDDKLKAVESRLGDQIADLSAKIEAMDQRFDRFRDAINGIIDEVASSQGSIASSDTHLRQLRQRLDRLESEVDALKTNRLA